MNNPSQIGARRQGKGNAPKLSKQARQAVLKRTLKTYLWPFKFQLAGILVLMLTANVLALIGPKLSGNAIDALAEGPDMDKVIYFCVLMALFYLIAGVLNLIVSRLMIRISQKITYAMRRDVFAKLMQLPVSFFDKHLTGDIVSHISYDIDTINASLSNDLLQVCASSVTVIGSFIMMIIISPVLVSVFLITVPISLISTRYRTRKIRPLFSKRSAKLGELNGYAEEMLSGQKTIKTYHREEQILSRFDIRNEEAVQAYYKADYKAVIIGPTVNFINNLSLALVTILGSAFYMGTLAVAGWPALLTIGLGDVASFVQYSRKFAGPINEFANITNEIQSAMAAADRVYRILDEITEPEDAPDASELTEPRGAVDIENVSFGYLPDRTIIHDLNLHVEPGQTIAIVGPTGAGKTTIINLLMRFYDVDSGEIRMDGYPIKQLTRRSMRLAYNMVLQDTWLFCGSVRDNILYGRPDASDEEIRAAAKAARIDNFIESLPNGYETELSDDGINISKGQKQMLTFARAMLSTAPLLILDEATSNVDSRTEIAVREAMDNLMAEKTCFIIAHRLSTIQHADKILVVRHGNVVESGTHQELMARPSFYRVLYYSQFQE
ncbi:MAG: ABC transporter ATP-binding protein [Clostridia bacterium]|nr:ABC transporter ATP-binding protein [Clostridia bacterium]